jgi:hypothetical protein
LVSSASNSGHSQVISAFLSVVVAQVEAGGGDAFFATAAGLGALGIADGVASRHDDAPSEASHAAQTLISRCAGAFDHAAAAAAAANPDPAAHHTIKGSSNIATAAMIPDPADVLAAVQISTEQPSKVPLLLAAMQPSGKLQIATSGDCRMLLLRGGCVVAETERQLQDAER